VNFANPQLPLIVVQVPAQSVVVGLIHREGLIKVVTVATTGLDRQFPLAPVTVYDVVADGVTVMQLLVAPVLQVYVLAPDAQSVCVLPAHTEDANGDTVKVGTGVTYTVVADVAVQPLGPVTVTLYTVVTVGQAVLVPELGEAKPVVGVQV
jgi:hypothetical protein